MNERIKQLAEQAGLRFTQLMSNPMVPVVDGKETDLEKFAELLVKECAQVANLTEDYDTDDYKSGRQWAAFDIKNHFVVEE